jgi:hypothetical protein
VPTRQVPPMIEPGHLNFAQIVMGHPQTIIDLELVILLVGIPGILEGTLENIHSIPVLPTGQTELPDSHHQAGYEFEQLCADELDAFEGAFYGPQFFMVDEEAAVPLYIAKLRFYAQLL